MWQDIVIMVAAFGLSASTIPMMIHRIHPGKTTCLSMISLLAVIGICFATLSLWLSVVAEAAGVLAWSILLWQGRKK